jgi:hypothetical protein
MSDNIVLANTTSTTTIRSLRLKVNEVIGVVNQIGRDEHTYLEVTNANAKFATKAYAASNTALRTLISDRYQVANVNTLLTAKATWAGLTGTNTALRILINDRIQVANVAAKYATKAYAASNAYVKLLLANTNAYIADVAASSGGGGGGFSAEALDYGFITSSIDVDSNRDYGTL